MKRILFILLVIILISLATIGGFLAYRFISSKQADRGVPKEIPGLNQEVSSVSGNPIYKGFYPERDGFMYELIGSFADTPVLLGDRGDKAIQGKIIVKDDPLKREINIIIGEGSGQVNLGTYKESLYSDSTWQVVSTQEAYDQIKEEKEVKLRAIYSYKGS